MVPTVQPRNINPPACTSATVRAGIDLLLVAAQPETKLRPCSINNGDYEGLAHSGVLDPYPVVDWAALA